MEGATVSWSSADTAVATVDSVGLVTAADGRATMIVAAAGDASGAVVTVTQSAASVVVHPAADTGCAGYIILYRRRRIGRLELASDLTFDRTAILNELLEHQDDWAARLEEYRRKLAEHGRGLRRRKPRFVPSRFLTFVRSPHLVAFEAPAANDEPSLTFTAVNVHLVYGTMRERRQEFDALLDWLIARLRSGERMVTPNFLLLGDLNLDFDKPRADRRRIDDRIRGLNARPNDRWLDAWTPGRNPDDFDFGVFDFADLFSRTLRRKSYRGFRTAEKRELGASFEHSVSDHLPIWVRIPRPGFSL